MQVTKDTISQASKEYKKSVNIKVEVLDKKLVPDENGNIIYIVYKMKQEKNNGEIVIFYKAVRFVRLTHTSIEAKENKKFMEVHTDIYRSMYSGEIDTIEVIANILEPTPIGLVILYGVQATGATYDMAVRECQNNFSAFIGAFTGTHSQCYVTAPSVEIMRRVFDMMEAQKLVTCVKGIPNTKHSSGDNRNPISLDTNTEEQLEQFIKGCIEIEYCLVMSVSPISKKYVRSWLNKTLDRWTAWEKQKQGSMNVGMSIGVPLSLSQGISQGTNTSNSLSNGTSENQNHSQGTGTSDTTGTSHSEGLSVGQSENNSLSQGTNVGTGTNDSSGTNQSSGYTEGNGSSVNLKVLQFNSSSSSNNSHGINDSHGSSYSEGYNRSESASNGYNVGSSVSDGTTNSKSVSQNSNDSWGSGTSKTTGVSSGSSSGLSQNMSVGANVGVNFSKGYQWHDMKVDYICELLKTQTNRLKSIDSGDGGAFVDVYISTKTAENQKRVIGAVGAAWNNPNAQLDMIRCEVPSKAEQAKLASYMGSFSPCQDIVVDPKDTASFYYKFSSVLATNELVAFNHPPRTTIPGIDNIAFDVPQFAFPTNRQNGEIFIGNIMQTKHSYENALAHGDGYVTDFKYTISNSEMLHAFIAAGSRSGKSVLAQRMVTEMYNNAFYVDKYGNKKHRRVLIFDPKGDWRAIASLIPAGKLQFYSIGKAGFHNLKLNLMRVPRALNPTIYVNNLIEMFCNAQGLLQKGKNEFRDIVMTLYKQAHVFDNPLDKNWAHEKSKDITMTDLYQEIMRKKAEAENKRNTGRNSMDAWEAYENRLKMFGDSMYTEYQVFCNKGGDSIEMLLGEDDLTIIESAGLETRTQEFFFTLAMTTIYEYALQFGPKGFNKSEVETVIVIEEANSIIAEKKGEFGNGDAISQFNTILDKSAGLGLFIWIITQKISEMPKSCIANSGLVFVGRNQNDDDKKLILSTFGYDERIDVKYKNFLPRMPIGVFIARTARTSDFLSQTPVLIKVAMLKTTTPEDEQLDIIIRHHDMERRRVENEKVLIS